MRVALVNNGTKEPQKLLELLSGNEVSVYETGRAAEALDGEWDLIVLSGSSRLSVLYNLDTLTPEINLVRQTSAPLIGVCFGAEVLAVAYDGSLLDKGHKEKGIYSVSAVVDDPIFAGEESFKVYGAHRWCIDRVPDELEVLASSAMGPEIVRHRTRPQYGFQFHPEKMCDETYGDELFRRVVDCIT